MPLEAPLPSVEQRAAELNQRYRHHGVADVLGAALGDPTVGRVAMVSSFGAESVVLLHLLSRADRTTPVLFLDTGFLFPETLSYQLDLTDRLGLSDVRRISAVTDITPNDSTDDCCVARKTAPLQDALSAFDAWITGRKRFQTPDRASLQTFEAADGRIKINPLAKWSPQDLSEYMVNNRLPRHPLVAKGYASIGCAPCTSPVDEDEDPRAGRWRNTTKTECGIHFENGRATRIPMKDQTQ